MSTDYLSLGSSPPCESCAQVGHDDYPEQSQKECRAWLNQIVRKFGNPPFGARLSTKSFPHEFGSYQEVVVHFDTCQEQAIEFAFNVENNLPTEWDNQAKEELGS